MNSHLKVIWLHHNSYDPVLIYIELDCDRWEKRKIEIFPDGRHFCADADYKDSDPTRLSIVALPSFESIKSDKQFVPLMISQAEFEIVWMRAKEPNGP